MHKAATKFQCHPFPLSCFPVEVEDPLEAVADSPAMAPILKFCPALAKLAPVSHDMKVGNGNQFLSVTICRSIDRFTASPPLILEEPDSSIDVQKFIPALRCQ